MVAEVDHLKKRIGDLEDAELEVMEQLESAVAARQRTACPRRRLGDALTETTARRDKQLAALDAEIAQRRTERGRIAPEIDPPLLRLYDKIARPPRRRRAAEAAAGAPPVCQLFEVNAADSARSPQRPRTSAALRECSRILVRTARSGLCGAGPVSLALSCAQGRSADELPAELAEGLAASDPAWKCPTPPPPDVLAAAEQAAPRPRLPDLDRTNVELGHHRSGGPRDLDQALPACARGRVPRTVRIAETWPHSLLRRPVDLEAHRRGMTLYADHRTQLHPPVLSEDAAACPTKFGRRCCGPSSSIPAGR